MMTKARPPHRIDSVTLDALVVMQITQHCTHLLPSLASGQLLGLQRDGELQVTHAFPCPQADEGEAEDADFQANYIKILHDVNVDNNVVGWYQSSYAGTFLSSHFLDTQFQYQENIESCVVIVYDSLLSGLGVPHIRAFRLSDAVVAHFKDGAGDLGDMDILEEIPVQVRSSAFLNGFLAQSQINLGDPLAEIAESVEESVDKQLRGLRLLMGDVCRELKHLTGRHDPEDGGDAAQALNGDKLEVKMLATQSRLCCQALEKTARTAAFCFQHAE